MRSFLPLTLVSVLCAVGLLIPGPARADSLRTIRVLFPGPVEQGVLFSRRTVAEIPLFSISLFLNDYDYATRFFSPAEYDEILAGLMKNLPRRKETKGPGAPCVQRLEKTVAVGARTLQSEHYCLSGEKGLAQWYERLRRQLD